jgi:hypothetical protein
MFGEPTKEHAWLQQLLGDWTYEGECYGGPDQPPMKSSGTETVRPLGDFWIVAEGKGEMPGGGEGKTMMTLGYDVDKKCYQGTWVGSMMPKLWVYECSMDADKRILTLAADGPSMSGDGSMQRYEDIIEIVDKDHRILRARALGSDGKWNQFMQTNYRRKG